MSDIAMMLARLRGSKERVTVARRAIISLFLEAKTPMTAFMITAELLRRKTTLNKTTVYRELKFLETKGMIRAMQFDERNKRYELTPTDHRHHLICTTCKKIEDVVLHHDLDYIEERVAAEKKFKIQRHALEFYGLCGGCQ